MSARHTQRVQDLEDEVLAAKIAAALSAQLGREAKGLVHLPERIARDALTVVVAGIKARRAIVAKRDPAPHYATARKTLSAYDARAIERGDTGSMVLGVRFASNSYRTTHCDVMFVA